MNKRLLLANAIWLVPIGAIAVVLILIGNALLDTGPKVTVTFLSAEGIQAGKTKVRYRDVEVGVVDNVEITPDRSHVAVEIKLSHTAAPLAVSDSSFWVVKPRVGIAGISGLNTVLSGAYVVVDPGHSNIARKNFTGLEFPPAVTSDQHGHRYVIKSETLGSIDIGSPVYYRHMQVGRVVTYFLDHDGNGVTIHVFVDAPYDRYVSPNSKWWHASGVDLRLDSGGMRLNTESIAAVLMGGLVFQSLPGAKPEGIAPNNTVFQLAQTETDAMRRPDGPAADIVMKFQQSLRGLVVGAPVDFRGIELGIVTAVDIEFDPKNLRFDMPVTLKLFPSRLGRSYKKSFGEGNNDAARKLLERLVTQGLRGQLRTGSLITNQRYIALDIFPNAPSAKVNWSATTVELPTVPNSLEDLQDTVGNIVHRLDKIPFDKISAHLDEALKSANGVFIQLHEQVGPEARETLLSAQQAFASAQTALQSDSPLQSDLREAALQLNRTLQSLQQLTDYLQHHPESLLWGKSKDRNP